MSSSDNASTLNSSLTSKKNQSGVQSLEIGLSILEVLIAQNAPMMLKDIAQTMQMHPAKSHRYLVSLIRKGYACKLDDGRYGLGEQIHALGALAAVNHTGLTQNNILQRLTTAANDIKDDLNCGVQIAKWFNEGPIIIHSVEPNSPISIITRIGSRMPLTTSATGQLFASYQSDSVIKPLVLTEWQNVIKSNHQAVTKWHSFTELKEHIRHQGYATVTGDMVMGINAIAIPIVASMSDSSDSVKASTDIPLEYAITIIGTSEQLPMNQQQEVFNKIMAIAKRYQLTQ